MSTTILYRLFGIGKLPKPLRAACESEGIVLVDEGVRASVTLRGFRAPGRYSSYRRSWFSGALVLTGQRFAAFAYSKPLVNVPLHGDHLDRLELSVDDRGGLCIGFDAADFHSDRSGRIDCRYATEQAQLFLDHLISR